MKLASPYCLLGPFVLLNAVYQFVAPGRELSERESGLRLLAHETMRQSSLSRPALETQSERESRLGTNFVLLRSEAALEGPGARPWRRSEM